MTEIYLHNFYIGASDTDFSRGTAKGGETEDPFERIGGYGTSHFADDYFRYRCIIRIPVSNIQLIHRIEKSWLSKFEQVSRLNDDDNLNCAYTVEGVRFNDPSTFITTFKATLYELNLGHLTAETYDTNESINCLLRYYRSKKEPSSQTTVLIEPYVLSLKDKFFTTFLPEKIPRRIQLELWHLFDKLCATNDVLSTTYRGIVQWPTGTGKTIAILLLIVLAKERCKRMGKVYRGLLVTGKTDIFKTIQENFQKLKLFGITVMDGTEGKLSKMVSTIPTNQDILLFACHQSLTNEETVYSLPEMNHVHYDEVHRITGEKFFTILKDQLITWKTDFLTGTSATPKTSSPSQNQKLAELFGNPYTILHRCDVEEAVREGWIAKPRFIVKILPKLKDTAVILESYVDSCVETFMKKGTNGKAIFYIETSMDDVLYAYNYAKHRYPSINFYNAVDGHRTDDEFLKASVSSTPEILFACQRYREGSDIVGLEITGKLMGNTTSAYILLQICGRSLRIDKDPTKEGWCIIVRPSDEGTTEEDVLDSIVLEIAELLGNAEKSLKQKEIETIVRTYFGEVSISGKDLSIDETIARVQASYLRIQYAKRTPKERYETVRAINKEMGLQSKEDYRMNALEHSKYIEEPNTYFKEWWVSWYHFLGVDTAAFPQTKSEWIRLCKEMGFTSWSEYKEKYPTTLPANPGELYEDYTNWDKEFGIEEEIVW